MAAIDPNATPSAASAGTQEPSPPASHEQAAPAAPSTGDELRFSKSAFEERLKQAKRAERAAFLKANGFDSEEAFTAFKKATDEAQKVAEEKRKAEMTELERYKADLAERDQRIAEAESARQAALEEVEAARTEAHLHRLFAERGIKDAEYAVTLLEKHAASLPDGVDDFDEAAVLDEFLTDPRRRYALGVDSEPPTATTPASTTAPKTAPAPRPPQSSGPKRIEEMTDEEFRAWERDPNAQP